MLVSLSGLAVWDMLLLVSSLFHHSLWATLFWLGLPVRPWDTYSVALDGLHECAHVTSVSAERFFAVTRPFHFVHKRNDKHRRQSYARMVGGLIRVPLALTCIACLLTLPCSFEYTFQPCSHNGHAYSQRSPTALLRHPYYRLFYRTILLSLLKTFGPFIVITLLTIYTMKGMRETMDSRAAILMEQGQDGMFHSDKDKTRSLQTISMLLLGKFLLLRCWPTSVAIGSTIWGGGEDEHGLTPDIAHFLLLLNSTTNALVFVVLKSAFESRRLRRIRMRQREMVAKHAEQVLSIGKLLAGDRLLLLHDEGHTFIVR